MILSLRCAWHNIRVPDIRVCIIIKLGIFLYQHVHNLPTSLDMRRQLLLRNVSLLVALCLWLGTSISLTAGGHAGHRVLHVGATILLVRTRLRTKHWVTSYATCFVYRLYIILCLMLQTMNDIFGLFLFGGLF